MNFLVVKYNTSHLHFIKETKLKKKQHYNACISKIRVIEGDIVEQSHTTSIGLRTPAIKILPFSSSLFIFRFKLLLWLRTCLKQKI